MKRLAACAVLLMSSAANAQSNAPVGLALERYSVLAGAIQLNVHCKLLSDEETKQFGREFGVIHFSLMAILGDTSRLASIAVSARKSAESEPYKSCGDEARTIIEFGVAATKSWSAAIRDGVFTGAMRIQTPTR